MAPFYALKNAKNPTPLHLREMGSVRSLGSSAPSRAKGFTKWSTVFRAGCLKLVEMSSVVNIAAGAETCLGSTQVGA